MSAGDFLLTIIASGIGAAIVLTVALYALTHSHR